MLETGFNRLIIPSRSRRRNPSNRFRRCTPYSERIPRKQDDKRRTEKKLDDVKWQIYFVQLIMAFKLD